jgi:hypothetical protein
LFRPGGTWITLRKLRSIQATLVVAQMMIMAGADTVFRKNSLGIPSTESFLVT